MNLDIVLYLVCPECGAENLSLETYLMLEDEQVIEGRLICQNCSNWFRIENGIVDLLPLRLRQTNHERFVVRNERFAVKHGLTLRQEGGNSLAGTGASAKTKPIGAFEDVKDYEQRVVNNPYYKALDHVAFYDWMNRKLGARDLVLDIGCGTGRQCLPLAERGIRAVGMDVDEDMLEVAYRKIGVKSLSRMVDLIIADGENPPVRKNVFSACVFYGVLHHLSSKRDAIANASAKLVEGGHMYSLDPHKSPARLVFDFLMRVWQLYIEEASDDPLITENQLYKWMRDAGIEGEVRLSTYLPPHIFVFAFQINVLLLKSTDRILSCIPRIRNIGGVIIFEGRKVTEMQSVDC